MWAKSSEEVFLSLGQLQRQLSFADETLDELSLQIYTEEPELDWLEARPKVEL